MAAPVHFDFVPTLDENDDIQAENESSESDEEKVIPQKKKKKQKGVSDLFNNSFVFRDQFKEVTAFDGLTSVLQYARRRLESSTLDQKIAQIRNKKRKLKVSAGDAVNVDADEDDEDELEEDVDDDDDDSEEDIKADTLRVRGKKKKKRRKKGNDDDEEEEGEKISYSAHIDTYDDRLSFQEMNLSRPLLKAVSGMNFGHPTPIQSATIPLALLAKDICACAITGSGKTAAFMLPVLERLLYRPRQSPSTRVLVLEPSRELAVQVHQVSRQLALNTNIEIALSTGGLDVKAQEAALRLSPDIVIATPGRLIDHLHNAPHFNLRDIEILILDEADRMLDEFFAEQMKEIIQMCSPTRQTMLFSATMTEQVKDLAVVSLKNPVKIFINENTEVAHSLRQEFIRIRPNREGDREAVVSALVSRTFQDHCIVFIQTKKQAHRMHLILGLLGIRVGELHSNLSQAQRLEALKGFKDGDIDILLATDLASRGLDIDGVKTVINFTMPNTVKHYVHRVGRTARAGKSGRSVTLVGELERKMLKEIVKKARNPVKSRVIPQEVISKYRSRISSLEEDIKDLELAELEEKEFRTSENKLNQAQRVLEEKKKQKKDPTLLQSNQRRTWFQSRKQRMAEKSSLRLSEFKRGKKSKKDEETPEDRVSLELAKSQLYSARYAKKQLKAKRIRACPEPDEGGGGGGGRKGLSNRQYKKSLANKKKSSFAQELTNTSVKALKSFRHGPSYQERKELGLAGKKKQTKGAGSFNRHKGRR